MTSCSQNRHATKLRYISLKKLTILKEVGFEPTIGKKPNRFTICHHKPLGHSFIHFCVKLTVYLKTFRLVLILARFNFFGLHPLWGDKL